MIPKRIALGGGGRKAEGIGGGFAESWLLDGGEVRNGDGESLAVGVCLMGDFVGDGFAGMRTGDFD